MKTFTLLAAVLALSACDKLPAPANALHAAAIKTCKQPVEARAVNPRTLAYLSTAVVPTANGQLDVTMRVSARNEIGTPFTLQAKCVVSGDGKSLVGITTQSL